MAKKSKAHFPKRPQVSPAGSDAAKAQTSPQEPAQTSVQTQVQTQVQTPAQTPGQSLSPQSLSGPTRPEVPSAIRKTGWVRRTLTAEFLSDAHFGSGLGGGGIDALVARDRLHRHVIWTSQLEGVLRDAARRLRGEDHAGDVFGRSGGQQQRAIFTSLYSSESPDSHIWRSTARASFDNRAPKDETLRVIEYVPRGTKLVGAVELPANQLDILTRLVQEVDSIGGGRSTGAGRVKLSLSEASIAPRKVGTATGRLLLLLKNRDPLCIAATATPDTLIPSFAFVPGRTLLGSISAWLIAEGDSDTASLFTSGQVSVSDALPLPMLPKVPSKLEAVEVLPAPLSLRGEKPKGRAGSLPWWAQSSAPVRQIDARGVLKSARDMLAEPEDDLFVYRGSASEPWMAFRPARHVRLRNGHPDTKASSPLLFAIEQIAEDTHFLAELRAAPEVLKRVAERLAPVLEARRWLRIGRAGAPVEVAQIAWAGGAAPSRLGPQKATVLLTLTSDLLVRDEHLRWRTALGKTAIEELFGADIQLVWAQQDSVMVHGFNGTSRLWRMPAAAIRRGSVFEVSGPGVTRLAERAAKAEWLGERTHEGFGRFRVDVALPGVTSEQPASASPTGAGDADEESVAAKTQGWFASHRALARPSSASDRKPSLSQWFTLVADLERGDKKTIDARLNPTTAGGKNWKHKDAEGVLRKLQALDQQQALHARLFVRWLRAEMRKGAQ